MLARLHDSTGEVFCHVWFPDVVFKSRTNASFCCFSVSFQLFTYPKQTRQHSLLSPLLLWQRTLLRLRTNPF